MKYTKYTDIQLRNGKPTGLRTPKWKETAESIGSTKHTQNEDIATLTVATAVGVFDGNEASTNRMSNAARRLLRKDNKKSASAPHSTKWKMHDNKKADVTADDLEEALDLIAAAMTAIIDA